jgi:transcriptional regulator with XRE-family HTH domain
VINALKERGWTQHDLAVQADMKDSFISRVVNGSANCTLDTIGRIFFALGIKANIVQDAGSAVAAWTLHPGHGEPSIIIEDISDAQSIPQIQFGTSAEETWPLQAIADAG